jgi:hypothetical protein
LITGVATAATFGLRATKAEAATGDPILAGQINEANAGDQTTLRTHVEGASTLLVANPGGPGSTALHADGPNGATGLRATSVPGPAVHATSAGGIGVLAEGTEGGLALRTLGRSAFSTAGVDTIAGGTTRRTVTVTGAVSSSSAVLVTFLADPGVAALGLGYFVERRPPDQFTVHLRARAAAPVPFGYFVIN